MVVTQYPHIASVYPTAEAARNEETGDYQQGSPCASLSFPCRAEPQTAGSVGGLIKNQDGSVTDYTWILYCPLDTPVLLIGSNILVYGVMQVTDTVKRYSQGQLNTRIWL